MHPLLEDILNEPRLKADPTHLVLVLLPPQHSLPPEPRPFDFLANHVIATPWQSMLEQTKIAPRPSLSASVISRLSPHRVRGSISSSSSLLSGIRSRSKSTLISSSNSKDRTTRQSPSLSGGTALTTFHGKSVILHNHIVTIAQQKLTVTRETIFYDENDLPTHLLLYLDQEIKDLSPVIEEHRITTTGDTINPVKAMLQKTFNASHPSVRRFCDTALQETNLGILHTLTKDLLDEGFLYVDQYLESTPTLCSIAPEEAYKICESHVMEETYDVVFFKIAQLVRELDVEVSNVLESMHSLGFVQLGLPGSHLVRRRVERAIDTLRCIGSYRTPAEKLDCLLASITQLSEFHPDEVQDNEELDSDALVSMLIITLIRSHVPHLMANMTYMKEFTFEESLEIGKYGFAISTLEAVLQYTLESRTQLASVSDRNDQFWTSIRQGDIKTVQSILRNNNSSNASPPDNPVSHRSAVNTTRLSSLLPTVDLTQVQDPDGNTPLLIAAGAGQPAIVQHFLLHRHSVIDATNNAGQTALMRACQSGSVPTVKLLLADVFCRAAAQDHKGYTAFLHACVYGDIDLLDLLLADAGRIDPTIRNYLGQGPLHLAGTPDALKWLIRRLPSAVLPWKDDVEGQTFLHVQKDHPFDPATMLPLLAIRDRHGQTPLLAWAASGWFDCIEQVLPTAGDNHLYAQNEGRTILHAMALALDPGRPLVNTSSIYTIENIVQRLASLVDVRDWANGQTALHLATSLRLTDRNRLIVYDFIRSLVVHAGARVDSINLRGVRPAHACRDPDMVAFLDEVTIEACRGGRNSTTPPPSIDDVEFHHSGLHRYAFRVTRASSLHSPIRYTIASASINHPHGDVDGGGGGDGLLIWQEGLKTVERTLGDFYQLRKDIAQECPESFLPTLRHLVDPEHVDLRPTPPFCLQEEAVMQLDGFMQWLQSHPTLRNHDLVRTFVRSEALERETIEHASFARRHLLLETIGSKYHTSGNDFGGSEDEEYFFSFSQHQIETLRSSLAGVVRAGRRVTQCRRDLEIATSQLGEFQNRYDGDDDGGGPKIKGEQDGNIAIVVRTGSETRRLCIAMTGDTAYGSSPLDDLVRGFQMMRDLTDGILMALQRPFWLLHRRIELRDHLEHERDHLRRAKTWNEMFSTQRRQIEQTQENVVKALSDLAQVGGQITQSHQMISDEMAHFQRVHPVQLKAMIKSYCQAQLQQERLRILWLQEQASGLVARHSRRGSAK